jgi:hypothetical protein
MDSNGESKGVAVRRAEPGQHIDTLKRLAVMAYLQCITPQNTAWVR